MAQGEQAQCSAEELALKTQINTGFSAVQEQGEEGNPCLSSLGTQISAQSLGQELQWKQGDGLEEH